MKRITSILLCLLLLLCGCEKTDEYQKPARFYYLSSQVDYASGNAIIDYQTVETSQMGQTVHILRSYLQGLDDSRFVSPFPTDLQLHTYRLEENVAYLVFSDELAELTNLDLTLACSCIALTCMDLTGASQVSIEAESSLLGGQKTILLDKASMQLTDNSTIGE